MYRVHFKWKEKEIQLTAKSLDLTHPYFVSIKDLVFPDGKKLIINPSEDEIRKAFSGTNHLMIPFQSVYLIEELTSTEKSSKVMPFGLITEKSKRSEQEKSETSVRKEKDEGNRQAEQKEQAEQVKSVKREEAQEEAEAANNIFLHNAGSGEIGEKE